MIGQTISHYKILEKLGEGGMGEVYKAQDLKLDRFVALKFLPRPLTDNEEAKKRFIHEAKAASALDHPNICNVHEIDDFKGQAFIAMECCEGETLRERIARDPLKLEEAIDIAKQVAEGLTSAHKRDIIHRDGNALVGGTSIGCRGSLAIFVNGLGGNVFFLSYLIGFTGCIGGILAGQLRDGLLQPVFGGEQFLRRKIITGIDQH